MPLTPTFAPSPRHDLLVTAADGSPRRHTEYSGKLIFGAPGARGTMMARMDFNGALFLPDGLAYLRDHVGDPSTTTLTADVWIASVGEYLFVPRSEVYFADDPREPGVLWLQLGLIVQGYSGAVLGYRVVATVPVAAVRA